MQQLPIQHMLFSIDWPLIVNININKYTWFNHTFYFSPLKSKTKAIILNLLYWWRKWIFWQHLEEQLVDLSSLLYDHRLGEANFNCSEILQSSIFTQQWVTLLTLNFGLNFIWWFVFHLLRWFVFLVDAGTSIVFWPLKRRRWNAAVLNIKPLCIHLKHLYMGEFLLLVSLYIFWLFSSRIPFADCNFSLLVWAYGALGNYN